MVARINFITRRCRTLTVCGALRGLVILVFCFTTPADAVDEVGSWGGDQWSNFAETALRSGFDDAHAAKGGRQPILRALAEFSQNSPDESASFTAWLQGRMKSAFQENDRDLALSYKGFLTCLQHGDCRRISETDGNIDQNSVEPFKPLFDRKWRGSELIVGVVDWETGQWGGRKFAVTTQFWREDLNAYVVLASFIVQNFSDPNKVIATPMELRFYSPCTFTGRGGGDGVARDGGPDLSVKSAARCVE